LAQRISLESGIDIPVNVDGTPVPLGGDIEDNLTMLIREALQNAIRHAAPTRLSVALAFERSRVRVEIQDDGQGFDPTLDPPENSYHFGLIGMRERVELLDGEFQITSARGQGTRIQLSIPLPRHPTQLSMGDTTLPLR
jgi:two-component system sensor histidine kinase DegS